ncbi:phage tail sheath subtilisin-like domain-containing protein [Duganella sp. sic0402]|uniref:phage tail sheath family protein n=1 Tax=Duganella sp. sic0402 TaxID=2854786 RepID=UPI001C491A28|nr:phage tail sheath C-terminal domain-containing protein [Duganella sp. sic0402]MBV7534719.1 phage tail sheath subtilisin-like domain-containing protein [Duganella sp. sic0402]
MTSTSLAKDRKTPGVYVTEFPSFPASIVGVPTAVPIFIGYTETAADPSSQKQVYGQAIPLRSMADYQNYFGGGFDARGVVLLADKAFDFQSTALTVNADKVEPAADNRFLVATSDEVAYRFNLYTALQLFYSNGGGDCFVVSVNNYWGQASLTGALEATAGLGATPTEIKLADLEKGLEVARTTKGPTIIVIPDACQLPKENGKYSQYSTLATAMMRQASSLQDRVALLDLPGALDPEAWTDMDGQVKGFWEAIAPAADSFSYGVAYGPTLQSTLLSISDIDFTNLSGTEESALLMNNLLTSRAWEQYQPSNEGTATVLTPKFKDVAARIGAAFPVTGTTPFGTSTSLATKDDNGVARLVSLVNDGLYKPSIAPADQLALDQYISNAVPLLGQIEQILADQLNITPPSGAMAGVWSRNDATTGVWNAPANVSLAQISAPKVDVTDKQQGEYNAPLNGNAIDILRAFPGRGTVVWGARTLDANSLDYRYVQVRRTLIYIEQSIKAALQQYVFAPNNGGTWVTVTSSISNFLTQFWQAGGLMGDKASDAFTVACGVPTTMSGLDVLNGYMIVNVTVQLIHPAEFIELTFRQTMQGV